MIASELACKYNDFMAYFESSWNDFVGGRKGYIATSQISNANTVTVTDQLSISVTAGGSFCVAANSGESDCGGGQAPTASLPDFSGGTVEAIYNDAVAMFRLAMEPVSYLHLLVPAYTARPAAQRLSWLPSVVVLGPCTMIASTLTEKGSIIPAGVGGLSLTDANTDSSNPYSSSSDAFGFPSSMSFGSNQDGARLFS